MSGNNAFTLQSCNDDRDDDVNWVQDWDFDEPDGPKSWVRIEDDDDDCLSALHPSLLSDGPQTTCSEDANASSEVHYRPIVGMDGRYRSIDLWYLL